MKLKHAALLTATAMLFGGISSAALADWNNSALTQNGQCWNVAPTQGPQGQSGYGGATGHGYWAACPTPAAAVHMKKHKSKK